MNDVFTYDEYVNGVCTLDRVGLPRSSAGPDYQQQPESEQPDGYQQPDLIDVPREFVYEFELADYHRDRAAYRAKGGNVQLLMRLGEERRQAAETRNATLATLAANRLKAMTSFERALKLVAPVLAEDEAVQQRILSAWGIAPEQFGKLAARIAADDPADLELWNEH